MSINRGHKWDPWEKVFEFLLRGRMIFCYHANRFLAVCLLSEIFTYQIFNFQGENCSPKCNFWPKLPPWCSCSFLFRIKTNATVSSVFWSTNYTQDMREGFCLTISNFAQSLATFVLKYRVLGVWVWNVKLGALGI